MTIWIYSGDRPSNGARALSKLEGFKRCRTSKYFKAGDFLVNWGCTDWGNIFPMGVPCILNTAASIKTATNKLIAFETMSAMGVKCVPWCKPDDEDTLKKWKLKEATIIGRLTLTGHSGHGIIIMEPGHEIEKCLLYTKYIFKTKEFRVHVVNGKVIDTQQKIKDPDREVKTWKVRSHENGFIFARNNIKPCDIRDNLAVSSITALGLDFGAVDIIEDKQGELYVLEVNTAPGLEGQTITNYGEAFSALIQAQV